jgi:hypothetical protein
VTKSFNHTLSLHWPASNYSSTTNFPWLSLTDNWTEFQSQSQSLCYVTTDCQSASLSWNKAPIWGLRPDLYYYQTVAGSFVCGALSDEGTVLSFTFSADPPVFSYIVAARTMKHRKHMSRGRMRVWRGPHRKHLFCCLLQTLGTDHSRKRRLSTVVWCHRVHQNVPSARCIASVRSRTTENTATLLSSVHAYWPVT